MKFSIKSDNNLVLDEISILSYLMDLITIILGVVLGMVIGYFIFYKPKYIGPDSNYIVKQEYIDSTGKKYKFKPKITVCPVNYSMDKLHNPKFKSKH